MHELVLLAPLDRVEPVSDLLLDELQALSVSVDDADADGPDEQPLFGEPGLPEPAAGWARTRLSALFDDEEGAAAAAAVLLSASTEASPLRVQAIREVPAEDWVRKTQAQFNAVPVTPDFWIVPTWCEVPAEAATVIRLDPGLAFGTGTHPTTRMCLRWIAGHADGLRRCARVLDYGCGSGILAIAAAMHGARDVDAVDIDDSAVQSTLENARANGVTLHCGDPAQATGLYGVVLANILATPLKLLAPLLSGHVAPDGHLVLAGILDRQADELTAAYAPWLPLAVVDREDGWVLMAGRHTT